MAGVIRAGLGGGKAATLLDTYSVYQLHLASYNVLEGFEVGFVYIDAL